MKSSLIFYHLVIKNLNNRRSVFHWVSLSFAFLFVALAGNAQHSTLLSGPMVGHTTATSATIWVETSHSVEVTVNYWTDGRNGPITRGSASGMTDEEMPHTGVIMLEGLPAGRTVHYELAIDGEPIRPETVQSFSLLPAAETEGEGESPENFTIGFASCIDPVDVPLQPVWTQIGIYRPDAFFFIGDNNYMPQRTENYETSETNVQYAMSRYHRYLRDVPGLRSIIATTPTYGIWDDHDYGPNNSDRTFQWKELSLHMFKKYWPNPGAGIDDTPGTFYSFKIADVEFFMLDDRYHRDPNTAPDRETMLGEGQLNWLKQKLRESTATFKVIVNGHIMTLDRHDNAEYWARFGNERDEFFNWMYNENINGVFFISGDWHVGSLTRLEFNKENYPLYELVSSNAGEQSIEPDPHLYKYNRQTTGHNRNFDGPIVNDIHEYNFGLLEFSGNKENRKVTLKIVDYHGEVRVAHTLTPKDLSSRWDE